MNKLDMIRELENRVCEVTFTKVSGEQRVMKCTLQREMIPTPTTPSTPGRTIPDGVVAAYDVENEGWRSFRVDSVTNFILS